jgi:glutamyl-tRNA reductase
MVALTSIDWKTSSLKQRESFITQHNTNIAQGVLLQTCNRVEQYHGSGNVAEHIVRHLFRVISGLESSLIGESAIVAQVKDAYQTAVQHQRLDKNLHKLFQTAFYVGKRVRKETGISKGAMSHSQAAVNFLFQEVGDIKNLKITIIGVNALNEKIIKFLLKKDVEPYLIGNRTYDKASQLANKYGTKAFHFDQLPAILEKTDVLITATAAPHFILKHENFKSKRNLHILDLAVPRDVDPKIGELPNVKLYDIEIIEQQIKRNLEVRHEKLHHAETIIENEVLLFTQRLSNARN